MFDISKFERLKRDLNQRRKDFVRIDLDTAFILLALAAETAERPRARRKHVRMARIAYESIVRTLSKVEASPQEMDRFSERVGRLRTALENASKSFETESRQL